MSSLIVVPLSDCNLDCRYCFGIKGSRETLDLKLFKKIVEQFIDYNTEILHSNSCDFIFLGGEVFLLKNWKKYLDILLKIQKKHKHMFFRNNITTNGTLLSKEVISYIKANPVSLSISLDGPKELHDANRIFKGGRGSFKIIESKIKKLKKENIKFNSLSVITKKNIRFPERMFKFFDRQNLNFKLNPVIPVKQAKKNLKELIISKGELSEFFIKVYDLWFSQKNSNVQIQLFDILSANIIINTLKLPIEFSSYCALSKTCHNILAVYPDGTVGGCDRLEGIPAFQYGNIGKGDLQEILKNKRYLNFKKRESPEKCKECNFCYLCNGGCTFESYIVNPNLKEPAFYCKAYKSLFQHITKKIRYELSLISKKRHISNNELANIILRNELNNTDLTYGVVSAVGYMHAKNRL